MKTEKTEENLPIEKAKENSINEFNNLVEFILNKYPKVKQSELSSLLDISAPQLTTFKKEVKKGNAYNKALSNLQELVQFIKGGGSIHDRIKNLDGKEYNIWAFIKELKKKNQLTLFYKVENLSIPFILVSNIIIGIYCSFKIFSKIDISQIGKSPDSIAFLMIGLLVATGALTLSVLIKVHIDNDEYYHLVKNTLIGWVWFLDILGYFLLHRIFK